MTPERRRPAWIYQEGEEPDVRFSFANERTFLSWIRTAVALLAFAVAVDSLTSLGSYAAGPVVVFAASAMGVLCSSSAWFRWARAERALRRGEPLSGAPWCLLLTGGTAAIGLLIGLMAFA